MKTTNTATTTEVITIKSLTMCLFVHQNCQTLLKLCLTIFLPKGNHKQSVCSATLASCGGDIPEDSPMRPAPVDVLPAVQTRALYNRWF